jgi:tetratricopeptide (TPR) repeat protein
VTRAIAVVTVLLLTAAGAALLYQATARQRDYRSALMRGDNALRDEQSFAAIEAYSGAIELHPDSMLAYLRRGQTYRRRGDRGDLDAAARDFRKAAALDPSAIAPLEGLGDVNYQLDRYGRAADAFERAISLDDRSARISHKLALARYRDGDVDAALDAVARTVRLDERQADAHYLLGMCLREKGRTTEAMRAFERAVALAPGLVAARDELADLYGAHGRRSDQIEQLQVLAALDPTRVERQVEVAMAHAHAGHWDLAVLTLGSALERHHDEPLIYRALGQIWLERPRDDAAFLSKAREALERAASSPTAPSDLLTLYARALLDEGAVDDGERALEQAITRFPVEPSAFLLYAAVAEKQNHLVPARNALIAYGTLVRPETDAVPRAAKIAALSLQLNDATTAVEWLTQATTASPNDALLLASLADAQLRSGDRAAAQATIARGLDRDPKNAQLAVLARKIR